MCGRRPDEGGAYCNPLFPPSWPDATRNCRCRPCGGKGHKVRYCPNSKNREEYGVGDRGLETQFDQYKGPDAYRIMQNDAENLLVETRASHIEGSVKEDEEGVVRAEELGRSLVWEAQDQNVIISKTKPRAKHPYLVRPMGQSTYKGNEETQRQSSISRVVEHDQREDEKRNAAIKNHYEGGIQEYNDMTIEQRFAFLDENYLRPSCVIVKKELIQSLYGSLKSIDVGSDR